MKNRVFWILVGCVIGAIAAGIPLGIKILRNSYHYTEFETFYTGKIGNDTIQGISFFEYAGWRFMETNKWKIVLKEEDGNSVILYQRQSSFQESIPYRPKVERDKDGIIISDGIKTIRLAIEKIKSTDPNESIETTTITGTPAASDLSRQP